MRPFLYIDDRLTDIGRNGGSTNEKSPSKSEWVDAQETKETAADLLVEW
jgi:hypothetical protein